MSVTDPLTAAPLAMRPLIKGVADRLQAEFSGTFAAETIQRRTARRTIHQAATGLVSRPIVRALLPPPLAADGTNEFAAGSTKTAGCSYKSSYKDRRESSSQQPL
jgi:hypothetical protein